MRANTPFAFAPPPIAALSEEARILVKATRMWVLVARTGRNPRPALEALLGPAASRFSVLMDMVTAAWPDPFTTCSPCAAMLSPDEHSLLGLLALAGSDDEAGFQRFLSEMLPMAHRNRLWSASRRMVADRLGAA